MNIIETGRKKLKSCENHRKNNETKTNEIHRKTMNNSENQWKNKGHISKGFASQKASKFEHMFPRQGVGRKCAQISKGFAPQKASKFEHMFPRQGWGQKMRSNFKGFCPPKGL